MFGFGVPEMVILLAIVLVVFGAGKLPEVAGAMGKSILNFKKAAQGADERVIDAPAAAPVRNGNEAAVEIDLAAPRKDEA
ncbi:twin-arginine translocase TatA/TatE family subunit [Geobacter sp. FeAm09]|nr:twin-arginine translocase TatA/TatE family subunit [Geobacter sp. FeAm09]